MAMQGLSQRWKLYWAEILRGPIHEGFLTQSAEKSQNSFSIFTFYYVQSIHFFCEKYETVGGRYIIMMSEFLRETTPPPPWTQKMLSIFDSVGYRTQDLLCKRLFQASSDEIRKFSQYLYVNELTNVLRTYASKLVSDCSSYWFIK